MANNYYHHRTIVTGFFDIGRDKWNMFSRGIDTYLCNAKRNLSINENMIIFIDEKFIETVNEYRASHMNKTLIIPMKKENLPKYILKSKIDKIMQDENFKKDILFPNVPEMCVAEYNIIMWSKVDLLWKAIELNPFESTHFCWLDFGLGEYANIDRFPSVFHDKIRLLCRSMPEASDLNRIVMCKSHKNRFAGGFITGRIDYLVGFILSVNEEIQKCLDLNVVDCDQTMYSNVYLQNKDKFDLYFGDWDSIIVGY